MKKLSFMLAGALLAANAALAATTNIGPWTPLFKGVDISYARVFGAGNERTEAINCLRIDLTDPDISLLTTPKCTNNCAPYEVLAENTSHFLEQYGLQVAVNGSFYSSSLGPNDVPLGTSEQVLGFAVSKGVVVSPADDSTHAVSMFFTSNNVPVFVPQNWPPVDANGYYTAITGNILLLNNGVNVGTNQNDFDPRTAIGISEDNRFLYLMTADGRQGLSWGVNPPWSDGLNFYETADWLARFGAYNAFNIDGGGSTTMSMADCRGASLRLNRSSFVYQYGRERNIGHNFGVYAKPAITGIRNLNVLPGTTTAIVTWDTDLPADTQLEYGLTSSLGSSTPLNTRPVRTHIVTLSGLFSGTNYYFRARSSDGVALNLSGCSFTTTGTTTRIPLLSMTSPWKYTTNNLDGLNWKSLADDDSTWMGPSNACFHIENTVSGGITFAPRNTLLPPGFVVPIFRTYYFRTPFTFTGSTAGVSLTFSNYIDDGAVFYLNGVELNRIRVGASPTYATFATGGPCAATAYANDAAVICPDMFNISGNLITNLIQGTNMLAVEVHNLSGGVTSQDIFFGSALFANVAAAAVPRLLVHSENGLTTIFWNGPGFTLQRSSNLSSPTNWSDVPGPVTQGSYTASNNPTFFYRLRN